MAIEAKRGCGYRKVGGLYLVGGDIMTPCDRLPIILDICPCCGAGVKYTRGWTWIQPAKLFKGNHGLGCTCGPGCPACFCEQHFRLEDDGAWATGKAGLLWIGKQFYKTPEAFRREGIEQGISRRISTLPRNFKLGKTYIFFAHIEGAERPVEVNGQIVKEKCPGIFSGFMPRKIERLVKQSELTAYNLIETEIEKYGMDAMKEFLEENPETKEAFITIHKRLKADTKRGITLVPVPDNDPDHQ